MARISSRKLAYHEKALALINSGQRLTDDDIDFCYEHFHEGADHRVQHAGAFFTPREMARDLAVLCVSGHGPIIDLCAGIGMLSFQVYRHFKNEVNPPRLVCVEKNKDYVEIGKRLLPQAEWHCGDILDPDFMATLGTFSEAISNPPFGRIKHPRKSNVGLYTGREFEFKALALASTIAKMATFIMPQGSTPFNYSYLPGTSRPENRIMNQVQPIDPEALVSELEINDKLPPKVYEFLEDTNIRFNFNAGVNCGDYAKLWKQTNQIVEICTFDFNECLLPELDPWTPSEPEPEKVSYLEMTKEVYSKNKSSNDAQLTLF